MRGTSLSDISHLERGVEGLGSRSRTAWMKIHPLTRRAASVLMPKHVGLARRVSPRFLIKRTRTSVGQRFYYLEIAGARVLTAPAPQPDKVGNRVSKAAPPPARASQVNVTLDFKSHQFAIYDFLSEASATEIAQAIRRGQSRVALTRAVRASLRSALRTALSSSPGKKVRIVREAQAEEGMIAGLAPVLKFVGHTIADKATDFVIKHLLETLRKDGAGFTRKFTEAAESPADGVTLIFTLSGLGSTIDVFSKDPVKRVKALARLRRTGISGSFSVDIKAGFHRQ